MKRFLLFAALLFTSSVSAATISSASCPGTGCSVSFVADTPALAVQVTGTWSGSIAVELSNDGTTFVTARAFPVGGGAYTPDFTANGGWTVPTGGMAYFRVRAAAWTSGAATVTTRPTASVVAADVVRSVGSTFGAVEVAGAVTATLSTSTLSALNPTCTFAAAPPRPTLTTTPVDTPTTPLTGRSEMLIINLSATQEVWCCRGAGCTPTSGAAYVIRRSGDQKWEGIRDTDTFRCRSQAATADINIQEAACVQE